VTEILRSRASVSLKREAWGLPGTWTYAKNGFGGLFFVVEDDRLIVDGGRAFAALAPGLSLDVRGATMARARMGWLGTRLFAHECVVLSGQSPRGPLALAVRLLDASNDALWDALVTVGVRPQ
jgi:hypothetical protein